MTSVSVRSLCRLANIPTCRKNAGNWLRRNGIGIHNRKSLGGIAEFVRLSNLPAPERRAVIEAQIADLALDPGTYDDGAHAAFLAAPATMREAAEWKAEIARYLASARAHAKGAELHRLVRDRFGLDGTSIAALKRLSKAVEGVDPINFAPALLAGYKGRTATAPMSEGACACSWP